MDKKYQKKAAVLFGFFAVFLAVGLPLVTTAQTVMYPNVSTFAGAEWYQVLMQFVISGFGSLVAMIGWALDYSIQNFILGFGVKYKTSNLGDTINSLWGTVRDIFNLTFIFGLIYIGFKMILDAGDSHARHTLVSLIGAALLVNFSLFITKFIVDFSNLAAFKVFEAFQNGGGQPVSISIAFANLLGVSSLFSNGTLANAGAGASILYLIGSLLVLLVLAYVYLAGAVLIAIRFVVLTIYLIFSPVMFLGWVFPSMHGKSEEFWKGFLGQAFFAPAFLFMLYLSYKVVYTYNDNIQKLIFNGGNGGYFANNTFTQADSLIPFFIMTITFLIASMVVAKNMGAVGAGSVIKIGNNMRKGMQGSMTSFAGRNTVGRVASWGAKNQDTKGGRIASKLVTVGTLGMVNNRTQRNILEAGKKAKFSGSYSRTDDKEYDEKVKSLASAEDKKAENKEKIKKGLKAQKDKKDGTVRTQAQNEALEAAIFDMQSIVAGMSTAQLESMKDEDREAIASLMTNNQVDAMMKSEKLGNDDKAKIAKARSKAVRDLVEVGNDKLTSELTKLTIEQIEDAGADFINEYAGLFSSAQIDDIKKSKKFNPSQRTAFSSARTTFQKTAIQSPSAATSSTPFETYSGNNTFKRRKAADVAGLGTDVLLSNNAIQHLQIGDLEAIGDKKTLERADRDQLRQNIETAANNGSIHANKLRNWLNSPQAQRLNW